MLKTSEAKSLPQSWEIDQLRSDISLHSGHHVLAQYCNSKGIGTPYLTGPSDFPDGIILQTKSTTRPTTICEKGDILITVKGSGCGSTVVADDRYCISRQLMALRVQNWQPQFIHFVLKSSQSFRNAATGLIPGLSRSDILDQEFLRPPLPEQRAIAEALSDVDGLINSLDKLIAKKRAIKQATMQQLLTGKTRLPGFSGEWSRNRIGEFSKIGTGSRNTQDRSEDGRFPFFVRSNQIERINSYSFDGEAVLTAGDGVGTGKVFHYINGRFDYHQRVYRISGFDHRMDGYFFYLYFSEHFYNRIMTMTAKSSVDSIRLDMIANMEIPVPPPKEQQEIASVIRIIQEEIENLEGKKSKILLLKQGMMQELLTGRVRLV